MNLSLIIEVISCLLSLIFGILQVASDNKDSRPSNIINSYNNVSNSFNTYNYQVTTINNVKVGSPENSSANASGNIWVYFLIFIATAIVSYLYLVFSEYVTLTVHLLTFIGLLFSIISLQYTRVELTKWSRFFLSVIWIPMFILIHMLINPPASPSGFEDFTKKFIEANLWNGQDIPLFLGKVTRKFLDLFSKDISSGLFLMFKMLGLLLTFVFIYDSIVISIKLMRNTICNCRIQKKLKSNYSVLALCIFLTSGYATLLYNESVKIIQNRQE